jgi:hypothetical protein
MTLLASMSFALACANLPAAPTPVWPNLPVPDAVTASQLADDLWVSDQPAQVQSYTATGNIPRLIEFYRRRIDAAWTETKHGEGVVLAAPFHGYFLSVELLPTGGSSTVVRTMQSGLHAPAVRESRRFWWAPPDSQLLSRNRSRDGCRLAEVSVLRNRVAVAANADFFARALLAQGFRLIEHQKIATASARGEVLRFGQGRRAIEITLSEDGQISWLCITTVEDFT